MRAFYFIAGTGKQPSGFGNFQRIESLRNYIGVKGLIHLHLHGEWETLITPHELRMALLNWKYNKFLPIVTVSL